MNSKYNNELTIVMNERNDSINEYNQKLDEINLKYGSKINHFKKRKKNILFSIIFTILMGILYTIIAVLVPITGILNPIMAGVFGAIFLVLFILLIITLTKINKYGKFYSDEMLIIVRHLKKARGLEEKIIDLMLIIIAIEDGNNIIDEMIDELKMKYKKIISEHLEKEEITAEDIITYFDNWKAKKNDEYDEVDISSRRMIAERKSAAKK